MKHLRIGPYELCAFAIIVFATVLRVLLIAQGWPEINSDEGTMGLMALHIAYHGEYPIFLYGQGYMGSLEAYLSAAFFHLFGPSSFALQLSLIVLFVLFLVSMYLLTSLLYTKKLALVTLALLSLGSSEMLFRELEVAGHAPYTLPFGPIILLLASWLALSSIEQGSSISKRRIIAYGAWGFIVGFAIWSDTLVLPFVLMAGLLLVLFCRSELRRPAMLSLLLGVVIGLSPLIIYNLTVPVQQGSFTVLGTIFGYNSTGQAISQPGLGQKIAATMLVSLPSATGANTLCSLSENDWPLSGRSSPHTIQCAVVHGAWGLGFIILWTIAVVLATRHYWKLQHLSLARAWSAEERRGAIRSAARLMLLGSAGLPLLIFVLGAPSASDPRSNARYLIGLLIAIPAVIWPLWYAASTVRLRSVRFAAVTGVFRYAVLLLIGAVFLMGTIDAFSGIPSAHASFQQQDALIHNLLHIGATRIYSDYWTCDRIIFASREQIICSVVDEHLQPGYDRYLPYRSIVRADPHPAYVFPLASAQALAFAGKVADSSEHYQRFVFNGYVVYISSG